MKLEETLSIRFSKKQTLLLAERVSRDPKLYRELIRLIGEGAAPIPQYGAWVLQHSADMDSSLIVPYVTRLLSLLEEDVHDAVKRAILRSISNIEIPEKNKDQAVDLSFRFLEDVNQPVAIKMFSMCVLWNVCQDVPELLQELGRQIEVQLPISSAGFKNKGNKILKELKSRQLL